MVTEIIVEPLVGVEGVKVGTSKNDLIAALGKPERVSRGKIFIYFASGVRVHFDRNESVCFVERMLQRAIDGTNIRLSITGRRR